MSEELIDTSWLDVEWCSFMLADVMYGLPFSFISVITLLIASLYAATDIVVSSGWGRSASELSNSDPIISL